MVRPMQSLFRRADAVEIETAGGERYFCRGTVRPLKTGAPEFGRYILAEYGEMQSPLWMYLGGGTELLTENCAGAVLRCGGEVYRVLSSEAVRGFGGVSHVRGVLERTDDHDGE